MVALPHRCLRHKFTGRRGLELLFASFENRTTMPISTRSTRLQWAWSISTFPKIRRRTLGQSLDCYPAYVGDVSQESGFVMAAGSVAKIACLVQVVALFYHLTHASALRLLLSPFHSLCLRDRAFLHFLAFVPVTFLSSNHFVCYRRPCLSIFHPFPAKPIGTVPSSLYVDAESPP